MPPPSHPVLVPYLTASHLSAVDSYANGPGFRATAPKSPGGVKKAKKTRAAYLSRLRRAAYMEMLEGACEKADLEKEQIAARLEAKKEERFVLLHNIRVLKGETSQRIAALRGNLGETEAFVAILGAAKVVATADLERAEDAIAQRAEMVAAISGEDDVSTAEFCVASMCPAYLRVAEVTAVERAEKHAELTRWRSASSSSAEVPKAKFESVGGFAADFSAADMVATDLRLAEFSVAEEAEKMSREENERTVSRSRLDSQILADVDLDFSVIMRSMQCTGGA